MNPDKNSNIKNLLYAFSKKLKHFGHSFDEAWGETWDPVKSEVYYGCYRIRCNNDRCKKIFDVTLVNVKERKYSLWYGTESIAFGYAAQSDEGCSRVCLNIWNQENENYNNIICDKYRVMM